MSLVSTAELLAKQNFVVAANAITLEQAEALVLAAERSCTSLILQLSENTVRFHGSLKPFGSALLSLAEQSNLPLSVHLDHVTEISLIHQAIDLGFKSVMFDGSTMEFDQNLSTTATLSKLCQANGVWLEAELGEVGGKDGVHAPGVRTNPTEAQQFVERTGIDGLAVAVGSSHAMVDKSASLDIALIEELSKAVPVPLVLHGSSGVSMANLRQAIAAGIRKVNVATEFNLVFNKAVREFFSPDAKLSDPRKYLAPAREAMAQAMVSYLAELS